MEKLIKFLLKLNKPKRRCEPARAWTNDELKKMGHLFTGDVVNVSGWEDKDKEGGFYKDYFANAASYSITNFSQAYTGPGKELFLDLEKDLPEELKHKFDVVFNHTTLEHVFEIFKAFENLCLMSKDIVIFTMPFIQQQHEIDAYKDYWRMTPSTARRLFEKHGFKVVYESFTNRPFEVNYIFVVGSKHPEKWEGKMPAYTELKQICDWAS